MIVETNYFTNLLYYLTSHFWIHLTSITQTLSRLLYDSYKSSMKVEALDSDEVICTEDKLPYI